MEMPQYMKRSMMTMKKCKLDGYHQPNI